MTKGPQHQRDDSTAITETHDMAFDTPVIVEAFGQSDTGHVRASNEDHFLIARIGRYFETVGTSLPAGEVPDGPMKPVTR